ncbi:IQ calmodulin-binding motif-containing protein 1 [Menidia menidia]
MELEEEEALISELKKQLEREDLSPAQKISLLNSGLQKALNSASVQMSSGALARVKSQLYLSGVLSHCVLALALPPSRLQASWGPAASLAYLTSSCCVGLEAGSRSEAFHRLFLPSVLDVLLSLASQLTAREEGVSLFRKVMDSIGWLLSAHPQLTSQVLNSIHYEQIQMCDDVTVALHCVQLWIQTGSVSRDFFSGLDDDCLLLLLHEAVGHLAFSSRPSAGAASIRLMLLMAAQLGLRLQPLLLSFRGLDSLLRKDWRGRGFDQEVEKLIGLVQSGRSVPTPSEVSGERARAACVIQAAWRSFRTRRRIRSLNRAVGALQRRYRARRRQQEQQKEAQQWEEELKYQVCLRRQRARREFHQKQRRLLQLLPPGQVQPYLQACERRAAVLIQSFWRGFRERRRYNHTLKLSLRESHRQQQAARTLQRAVRRFLDKRRSAQAPPLPPLWIGQEGLTDARRLELRQQVEEYISVHRSSRVSPEECASLHQEAQLLLQEALQRGAQQRREEQRLQALLAHTHTQLELLREAPPLSGVPPACVAAFLSPAGSVAARGRHAHNGALQATRRPWWAGLGGAEEGATAGHAHLEAELEAELGGLFIGGTAATGRPLKL